MKRAGTVTSITLRLLAVLLVAPLSFADASEVPANTRALLVLRTLAYDRNLARKLGEDVVVGVAFRKGNDASETCQKELSQAIDAAGSRSTVAGKPARAKGLAWSSNFAEDLAASKAVSIYVCPGLDESIAALTKLSRSRSLLTFTGDESHVDAGVAIGFVLRETKPVIVVNLPAAKAEGADLDAALLARADVRR